MCENDHSTIREVYDIRATYGSIIFHTKVHCFIQIKSDDIISSNKSMALKYTELPRNRT